jgi:fibronectin type 3 domain-containing protein
VRGGHLAIFSSLVVLSGCGYPGPVLPPSPEIPAQVIDLSAVELGGNIVIAFHTPPRTTDNLAIKHFSEIDLRVGPALVPFDFQSWSATAQAFPLNPPPPSDPLDPQPIAMTEFIPAAGLMGQHVAIAVRTAVKRGNHFSAWSNRVVLDVVPPLSTPAGLKLAAAADGVILDWQPVESAKTYLISRMGPSDKSPVGIGNAEQPHFVDTTAQFDQQYVYSVLAANGAAQSLPSSSETIKPVDTFPPSVPTGVTALAGPESIEVSWQRSPEADLAGYYVYRSVDGGEFLRQGALLNLPAYSDRQVERGKTYRYQISAIDRKNNPSARSATVEIIF